MDDLWNIIKGIAEGGTTGNIIKGVLALLATIAFIFIKFFMKKAAIEQAKKETEEGHAKDQAGNADAANKTQAQMDKTKDAIVDIREEVKKQEAAMGGKLPKHENSGKCVRCALIFNKYQGFYKPLRDWFEAFQALHPDGHISCAGRGKEDQEACFKNGSSRAHWTQSSHNYNCAIDVFEMGGDPKNIYESSWFNDVLKPELDKSPELNWYGRPDAVFKEVPHIEWKAYKDLIQKGELKLVE